MIGLAKQSSQLQNNDKTKLPSHVVLFRDQGRAARGLVTVLEP